MMTSHHTIDYQLIRSHKKNLSLQVKDAQLIARAPLNMPKTQINHFIEKKIAWINKCLTKKNIPQSYNTGDIFFYLGKEYPLIIENSTLRFNGVNFIGCANKITFLALYKQHFANIVYSRLDAIAQANNLKYQQVRIKAQKTRWGSCSAKNNINLNYLLMISPLEVIDSVIVHELCHTVHKNHSQNFWNLVYKIKPDYKTHHNWLHHHKHKLQSFFY